jgi:DNA gyrase/topoisomerase IV subunit B
MHYLTSQGKLEQVRYIGFGNMNMTQIISVTINLKSNKNKKHKRAVKHLVL